MLQGTWSMQAALLPPPLRPKLEQEAPEKDNANNILVTTLCEVRGERLYLLHLSAQPRGIATAVALALR